MKRQFLMLMTLAFAMTFLGCKGEDGAPGAPGGGRITSSIYCEGTISGLAGAAGTALNGLTVEYNAVLTSSGDVYATSNVIDDYMQVSGTAFYAAAEAGAATGAVLVTNDMHNTGDGGYFRVSLNRNTMVTTIVYTDDSLGGQSPVNLVFTSAACDIGNW